MPERTDAEQVEPFRRHGDGCFKSASWLVIAAAVGLVLLFLLFVLMAQGLKH